MADLVQMLARSMVNRKVAEHEPYVLVLGAGASLTSGCSSYTELVDDFLEQYYPDELAVLNEEQDERKREETKRDRFYDAWRRTGGVSRHAFLYKHLSGDPSSGYEHLAWLVRHEYLRLIFSTNLDNHVEAAFTAAGITPNQDYEPLTNGRGKATEITRRLEAPTPRVKLVKLHGTLSEEDSYAWLPEEVFEFEDELVDALRTHLNRDVIILGHRMDDRDLDLPFRARGGEIWFVNPTGASDTRFKAVLNVRAYSRTITGDDARFDGFLTALRTQVEAIEVGAEAAAEEAAIHRFLRAIGLPGQISEPRSRYLHLPELYVKPEEYDRIRAVLDEHHAVVIAGEPHMGKTYTALHLLWEHFQQGWSVVHMKRDALAEELRRCGHSVDEFASRHLTKQCLVHLDDPFGEIEYQPLGPLQKGLWRLVHEVRRRGDCALILTSRIGVFSEAMGHVEGAGLLTEMGVEADIRVHTSYSQGIRREVLERYLNLYEPPWASDEALVKMALAHVPRILEAPHNLELFAQRSDGLSEEGELLDFARSCREMVPALADWIARLPAEDQLVFVLADSFPRTSDLAELRTFHRAVLGEAYQKGIIEHIRSTAWQSALDRLRDIVAAVETVQLGARLSLVHPSYSEAFSQALAVNPGLRDVWLAAMEVGARHDDLAWRSGAAGALVCKCPQLGEEGRALLDSLARDDAHIVRTRVGEELARNAENLGPECGALLALLSEDEVPHVRASLGIVLAYRYEALDDVQRKIILALSGDKEEQVRGDVAIGIGMSYPDVCADARTVIASLARDPAEGVRGRLAGPLAESYHRLDVAGANLVACLAADESAFVRAMAASGLVMGRAHLDARGRSLLASLAADEHPLLRAGLAMPLAWAYDELEPDDHKLLVTLAADQVALVRVVVAQWLARAYERLDRDGRGLLTSLATEECQEVRAEAAYGLAHNHRGLDEEGEKLLKSLAADKSIHVRTRLAIGLRAQEAHLDDEGGKLLERVEASLEQE